VLNTSQPTCSQCQSLLILVSKVTEEIAGSRFPQTTIVYRCSNKECQDEREKQSAKRAKLHAEKVVAEQKRIDEKLQKKQMLAGR
jgi:hypothetical protein